MKKSQIPNPKAQIPNVGLWELELGSWVLRVTQYNASLRMPVLAPGLSWIDLKFRGSPHVIATAVVSDAGGVALDRSRAQHHVSMTLELGLNATWHAFQRRDPHPADTRASGSRRRDRHARPPVSGAEGLRPRARHAAPDRSDEARRERDAPVRRSDGALWGEVAAVPASNIVTLGVSTGRNGSTLPDEHSTSRTRRATPRITSASSTRQAASRSSAMRQASASLAITCVRRRRPPTSMSSSGSRPPRASKRGIPETMFLTHFGPSGHVRPHLQSLIENLRASAEWVRRSLLEPGSDDEKARRYAEYVDRELKRHLTEEQILPHRVGAPFEVSWLGLARYWRKKESAVGRSSRAGLSDPPDQLIRERRIAATPCGSARPAAAARSRAACRSPPDTRRRDRRPTAPCRLRSDGRQLVAFAGAALDLEVHQAIERNRRRHLALDERHPGR